jgi:Tfp pilus assembly protein PilV
MHVRVKLSGDNRAFTLFEILIAMGLLTAAMGVGMTMLISAHKRFRVATDAVNARSRLALAADRMLADIRGSSGAEESGGALVLTTSGGKVTWSANEGTLVRECDGDKDTYAVELAGMRVVAQSRAPGRPFVEVAFELVTLTKRRAPGSPAPVLYVAASPRLGGTP